MQQDGQETIPSVEACEESKDPAVIAQGIMLAFLLSFSSYINTIIKRTNNKEVINQANLFLEQLQGVDVKITPLKAKKPGRPPKYTPEQLQEMNQRREELFVKFWTKYPRKEGEAATRRWWLRIRGLELIFPQIMAALEWQVTKWEGGKYAPSPAKYILDKRWEDKPEVKPVKKGAFGGLGYDFPQN